MINTNSLMNDLDAIFASNMFLKDEKVAYSLKGNVAGIFTDIECHFNKLENKIACVENQSFNNLDNIEKQRNVLTEYFKRQIDIAQQCLRDLGEWY